MVRITEFLGLSFILCHFARSGPVRESTETFLFFSSYNLSMIYYEHGKATKSSNSFKGGNEI